MLQICLKHLENIKFISKFLLEDKHHLMLSLLKKMKCIYSEEGDILFKKGDPANYFYIILKGSVSIYMPKDKHIVDKEILESSSKK